MHEFSYHCIDFRNEKGYEFDADVRSRLFLYELDSFDLEIFEELFDNTATISLPSLALVFPVEEQFLREKLQKFEKYDILTVNGSTIEVDRDKRKYYEIELERFKQSPLPGLKFFQNMLKKAPLDVTSKAYRIPKTSENTLNTIIEKMIQTPDTFERHKKETAFTHPLDKIVTDLFASPELEISANEMMKKYSITKEEFEKLMILLEYNLIGCIHFKKVESRFEPMISPFSFVRDFILAQKIPTEALVEHDDQVDLDHEDPFYFIHDLTKALKEFSTGKLTITDNQFTFSDELIDKSDDYKQKLVDRLKGFYFIIKEESGYILSEMGTEWLEMRTENKAAHLYRYPSQSIDLTQFPPILTTEKNFRELQLSLRIIAKKGWVKYSAFEQRITAPLSHEKALKLGRIKNGIGYVLPDYSDDEKRLITSLMKDSFSEAGIIQLGKWNGDLVLRMTDFGKTYFEV